jgi:type IV pilus assembly protein PilV
MTLFRSQAPRRSDQRGFTLIEVLVSMLILIVGLLGVAGMQLLSFQNNQNAYLRSQATFIAGDLLDRIRSNPAGHRAGYYDSISISSSSDVPAAQTCISSAAGCSPQALAFQDIYEWAGHFYNMKNQTGYKPTLPAARAVISHTAGASEYVVTVFWQEKDWQDTGSGATRANAVERFVELRTIIQ